MAGSSGVWLSVTPRVVNEMSVFRFADQRFGNCTFSAGVGVGHVSVRREAFDGVTLVVQQRAWPVDRRIRTSGSALGPVCEEQLGLPHGYRNLLLQLTRIFDELPCVQTDEPCLSPCFVRVRGGRDDVCPHMNRAVMNRCEHIEIVVWFHGLAGASRAVLSGFRLCTVLVTLGGGEFIVDVGHLLVSRRNFFVLTFGRPVHFFRTPVRLLGLLLCEGRILSSDWHLLGQLLGAHAEFFGTLSGLFGSLGCVFHEAPPPRCQTEYPTRHRRNRHRLGATPGRSLGGDAMPKRCAGLGSRRFLDRRAMRRLGGARRVRRVAR